MTFFFLFVSWLWIIYFKRNGDLVRWPFKLFTHYTLFFFCIFYSYVFNFSNNVYIAVMKQTTQIFDIFVSKFFSCCCVFVQVLSLHHSAIYFLIANYMEWVLWVLSFWVKVFIFFWFGVNELCRFFGSVAVWLIILKF